MGPCGQLAGKVALITGAGSGIGKATALLFAREGARVALLGRTAGPLDETAAEIRRDGGEAIPVIADVSRADQMQSAIHRVGEEWGRLDVVFANAGIMGVLAPLEELEPDEWDATLDVNLKGTFLTVKYGLPYLRKQGGAVIITSSVTGTRIFSGCGRAAYACSKAAQVAFAKMAALELAPDAVRVNVICPGWIETPIGTKAIRRNLERIQAPIEFPKGWIPFAGHRPGTVEQVAQLVLFLASDAARHITGTEVWIDGAESLLRG
jgi:NAD(P)-dependent dehydrogenase (short-subunit alcohol dehydrogenase family)